MTEGRPHASATEEHQQSDSPREERLGYVSTLVRVVAIVSVNLGLFEVSACAGAHLLAQRNLLYSPPRIESFNSYLEERDPILGWPSKKTLMNGHDEQGGRRNPFFPLPNPTCISLYGDSATFAVDVSDEQAWGALLSKRLRCRVANFGVTGYGTDQAYLRFSLNRADQAPVVILNHFSRDIRRNVNQFRNFLSPNSSFQLKPRFILEGEALKLILPPRISHDEALALIRTPKKVVGYDYFLPENGSGIVEARFPYVLAVGKLLFSDELQLKVGQSDEWKDFYGVQHPSGALQVTVAIVEKFVSEAAARGQDPIVAIIPDPVDLLFFRGQGYFSYAPLIKALELKGIPVLDVGMGLIIRLKDRDPCSITTGNSCSGYFNAAGNKLIADVYSEIFIPLTEQGNSTDDGLKDSSPFQVSVSRRAAAFPPQRALESKVQRMKESSPSL